MYTFFHSPASGLYPLNGFDSHFRSGPDSENERNWKGKETKCKISSSMITFRRNHHERKNKFKSQHEDTEFIF